MIGFSELIVIVLVAVMVISPAKFVSLAQQLGKVAKVLHDNKDDITNSVRSVQQEVAEVTEPIKQVKDELVSPIQEIKEVITNGGEK